ncbi:24-hydroxycholesterol 7-alpha-hydroxylase-like isoform X1 [Pelodiscus sinensis]|uniref:24-hydroxycholesterol 7-alpha-hydroxylase-like isoform X1 n=1 Tax=Pelodiscus sinensis TaxID=13735 RepID=UPI0003C4D51D|nr:24-hydroxycholesterol 7-alpha-hydroxylase-like isoform X1 [Pelodiscus sinensis]|eukprot:XP_006120737.1 24-hydroxycholesterol 7-alpha-hydroxylase-like isoform X1 [Pelodiscus sinensis]
MDIALAILLTLLLGLLMAKLALFQPRNRNSPPCISGWIPWFGAAFQFGKAPLEFIEQARVKYGPVFTVFALGNRFTFVTEEEGIEAFFTSKDLDFEQAVQPTIQRTTSIPADIFYRNHTRLYLTIKGKVSLSRLYLFAGTLCKELHEHMDHLGTSGTENLSDLIRSVMYPATINILFGKGVCPTNKSDMKEFEGHFQKYDEDFEYASQMPAYFMSNWSKSKKWLLKMFENVVSDAERVSRPESDSKTVLQHLLDNVHGKHLAPNYALLLLWASQANAMPVAFWTLAFILSHPSIYKNIMEDIVSVFGKAGKENIEVSEDDLKKLLLIKWCILEAIRLRSPGAITKKVVNPLKIQTFTIPAGDMLMVSPYWAHRNTKYFPDPETFKPDRWKEANLEKNAFLDGFMAFGRGKHQCPGRWLAVMEVHMLVVLLLYKYELILLDPVPKESPLHLVGTQQPMGACRVQYKPRQ